MTAATALLSFVAGVACSWIEIAPLAEAFAHAPAAPLPRATSASSVMKISVDEVFGAVASTFGHPDALDRYADLHAALEGITAEQVGPLLDRIERLPKRRREAVKSLVFTQACLRQPEAATAWLRTLRFWDSKNITFNESGSYYEYAELIKIWVRHCPGQVREEMASGDTSILRSDAVQELVKSAGDDPASQLAVLATIPAGRLRDNARNTCASWQTGILRKPCAKPIG